MEKRDDSNSNTSTTNESKEDISQKNNDKINTNYEAGVGQGVLYSPLYSHKLSEKSNNNKHTNSNSTFPSGYHNMRISSLVVVKERLMEKLAATSVPPEALEKARRMLEGAARDATVAAHALSKDALQRIKTRLRDIMPFLSPSLASKIVDDADREAKISNHQINKDIITEGVNDKRVEDQKTTIAPPLLYNIPSSKL